MNNEETFWANVDRSGDCWQWTGSVDSRGYGSLSYRGRRVLAHRLAYEISIGEIPRSPGHHGTVVMHKCDNRLCCRPDHLVIGSHDDNMADMREKGRRKGINTGEQNGRAKLTADQVALIRADTRGKRTIAKDYGISPAQAQRIRLGQQWSAA